MADDSVPINLTVDLYKIKMFLFFSKRAANTIEGVIFFLNLCVCICVCVCMCVVYCVYAHVHVFVEPEGDAECPLQLLYTSSVPSIYSSAKTLLSCCV